MCDRGGRQYTYMGVEQNKEVSLSEIAKIALHLKLLISVRDQFRDLKSV